MVDIIDISTINIDCHHRGISGCELCLLRVQDVAGHMESLQVIDQATQIVQVNFFAVSEFLFLMISDERASN